MATSGNSRLRPRRRKSGQTDYRRRLRLLRSELPRAVVRVTNRRTISQMVSYSPEGDKVVSSVSGDDLVKQYGWPESASRKSVSASYLVGYALGYRALTIGLGEAVLDIGLRAATPGARIFAALKGMVDAGLDIAHGESIIPSEERILGQHIDEKLASSVEATKAKIEEVHA